MPSLETVFVFFYRNAVIPHQIPPNYWRHDMLLTLRNAIIIVAATSVFANPAVSDPGDNYDNGTCYDVQKQDRNVSFWDIYLKPRCFATYARHQWVLIAVGSSDGRCTCRSVSNTHKGTVETKKGVVPKVLSPANTNRNCELLAREAYPRDCPGGAF